MRIAHGAVWEEHTAIRKSTPDLRRRTKLEGSGFVRSSRHHRVAQTRASTPASPGGSSGGSVSAGGSPPPGWRTAVFSRTPREVQGECSISRSVGTLIPSISEAPPWRPRLTLISPQHPTSKCYPVGVRASTCEFWGVEHNSNLSKCLTQKCVEVMETRGGREFLRKDMQIGKGESQSKDHRGGSWLPGVSAIRVWVPPQDILSHRYLILW